MHYKYVSYYWEYTDLIWFSLHNDNTNITAKLWSTPYLTLIKSTSLCTFAMIFCTQTMAVVCDQWKPKQNRHLICEKWTTLCFKSHNV